MYTLKKSLGQHFLKDEGVCQRIVEELQKHPFSNLVEVGPGGGAVTKYLIALPNIQLKAVEVDDEKVAYLQKTYPELKDKIIHQSILEIPPPFEEPFTVVGNFPYNISTEIVFKIIDWRQSVEAMVGMFQKEVALRLAAKEGSKVYGVTSILTQAFYDVEYLFEVSEESFNPPPKVKSAVIRLLPRKEVLEVKSEAQFKNLVKTAFQQRRKMLRNACKGLFDAATLEKDIFSKRPEQLSLYDFAGLTFEMQ